MTVAAIIQCTVGDLVKSKDPADYCIQKCLEAGFLDKVVLACPDGEDAAKLQEMAAHWGVGFYAGSDMNVANRLLGAAYSVGATVVIRTLLRQFYLDLDQVKRMVDRLLSEKADYVVLPADYNYALAADVGTTEALERAVHKIEQISEERERSSKQFSPWVFVEENAADFNLISIDGGPIYSEEKTKSIRAKYAKLISENQTHFKWNYPASSYGFMGQYLNSNDTVLDIACGKGQGVRRLAEYCQNAVGVDLTPEHIKIARSENKFIPNVSYEIGDAETFVRQNAFDAVVSLHTLEHLENPDRFFECSRKNLKVGGRLLLEVPLLLPHPLQKPLMPWHHKEYGLQELADLVSSHGFEVDEVWAKKRHAFVEIPYLNNEVDVSVGRLTAGIIIATMR